MWYHSHYKKYQCYGPYVKDWGCCSAKWHPSKLGHEVRAAHYSYFWLLIFKDALEGVEKLIESEGSVKAALTKIKHRVDSEHKHLPTDALFPSSYADNTRCITSFEPRHDPESHLLDYVVPNGDNRPAFEHEIFEMISDKGIITKARSQGYLDYKYMLYGNKDSSPLSIKITVMKTGKVHLCQPPGNWGKLPGGFDWFWNVDTRVYLDKDVPNDTITNKMVADGVTTGSKFKFKQDETKRIRYINRDPKETQNVCVDFDDDIPQGTHVITIVATSKTKFMISTIALP